jgi:signal transduction histidine kinase
MMFGVVITVNAEEDYSAMLQNARYLVKERRYGEALVAFSKILKSHVPLEQDAESHLKAQAASEAGEVLILLGQFDEAIAKFEAADKFLKESDTPKPYRQEMEIVYAYRLANCYALAGKWQDAKATFEALNRQRTGNKLYQQAEGKLKWIQARIFSQEKPTIRFAASLLAFLLTISLCLYIFARDPSSYLNLSLSFFLFSFALWQIADAIRIYILNPETAIFWGKALLMGIFLACLANLNFIFLFLQKRKGESFEALRWLFVCLPPAMLITILPTNLYTQGADLFYWHWENWINALVHKLFIFYLALYVIYGVMMVARANLTISKGIAARPITYMFFTVSFIFIPSLVAAIFVPISGYSNYMIGASSLSVIVMAVVLIYSIRRYHLIDVNAVIFQSLSYFVLTGLLLGGYVLLVNLFASLTNAFSLWLSEFGTQTNWHIGAAPTYVIATLIIALLFQPAKNRVQSLLDRWFQKDKNAYQQALLSFSQAITTILDLNRLSRLLVSTVTNAMGIDKGWLLIKKDDGKGYELVASVGLDESTKQNIQNSMPSTRLIREIDGRLEGWKEEGISIPLQRDEHLIGVLSLGRKYSGKPFTKADREILTILANQAALAITNAKLVNQLLRADQLAMLGRISAGIAHEVRNPLLAIKGAAQFLQGKFEKESEESEFAEIIVEESNRINQVITQFLDYARPAKPKLQPMDIRECLDRTLTLVNVELRHAKVELVRDYAPDLPEVLGDEKQLGQVFLNLIINAIEAMPNGGTLRIQAHQGKEGNESEFTSLQGKLAFCFIRIKDTGTGMSTEEKTRIFEPFYTNKENGLGLGLAIVREIVSEHGGTISVESKKGMGTMFTVGLPSKG